MTLADWRSPCSQNQAGSRTSTIFWAPSSCVKSSRMLLDREQGGVRQRLQKGQCLRQRQTGGSPACGLRLHSKCCRFRNIMDLLVALVFQLQDHPVASSRLPSSCPTLRQFDEASVAYVVRQYPTSSWNHNHSLVILQPARTHNSDTVCSPEP